MTIEIFARAAGVAQTLTSTYQPSAFQPVHEVGTSNRLNVRFTTTGELPEWIEWKLQSSLDHGATWRDEPATLLWAGLSTHARLIATRPGTSVVSIGLPSSGSVRIVARRNGGGSDTKILAAATFDTCAAGRPSRTERARPQRDALGRPIAQR